MEKSRTRVSMNNRCNIHFISSSRYLVLLYVYALFYLSVISSPVSSLSRSGLRLSTELRFDGIGKLGFGRFFNAAKACCTASCLTSV